MLPFHVAAREFDEISADRVADAAAARMQHHPHVPGLVQTHLDEMVAAAERAQLANPVLRARKALFERRMLAEDPLQGRLE
ncbi:hypothetical protein D3C83_30320 [compost metagenome]